MQLNYLIMRLNNPLVFLLIQSMLHLIITSLAGSLILSTTEIVYILIIDSIASQPEFGNFTNLIFINYAPILASGNYQNFLWQFKITFIP